MNLLPFPKEQTSSQQLNDFGLTVPPGGQYVNAFSFFFSSKETEDSHITAHLNIYFHSLYPPTLIPFLHSWSFLAQQLKAILYPYPASLNIPPVHT